MMCVAYDLPADLDELFSNQNAFYRIIEYKHEYDNGEALDYFISLVGIHWQNIKYNYGTEIIVEYDDYPYDILIASSGLGDMYSHGFETQCLDKITEKPYTFRKEKIESFLESENEKGA
jgi:hypothetical protein